MDKPFVSVIIPCYNDEKGIEETLSSLSLQDYPQNKLEIIVVDNNSTDGTLDVIYYFLKKIPSIKIERETKQSSYAARNRGIAVSKGDVLAFLDSDMTVEADWLKNRVDHLTSTDSDYTGCNVVVYTKSISPNVWERYNTLAGFPMEHYMKKAYFVGTGCLFIRKSILNKTGIFNERLKSGGDNEFGKRVKRCGFKMSYDGNTTIYHPARSSIKSLYNKYSRVAKGRIDLKLTYPEYFGKFTINYVIRRLWPFFHPPIYFNGLALLEKIKMLAIDSYVQYTVTGSELFYFIRRNKV